MEEEKNSEKKPTISPWKKNKRVKAFPKWNNLNRDLQRR